MITTLSQSITPFGLTRSDDHVYTREGREYVSVTQCLRLGNLLDAAFATEADRLRGAMVHDTIARYHTGHTTNGGAIDGYMRGYLCFLAESALRVDASEEMVADDQLRVAGTLDVRGHFIDRSATATPTTRERIDLIDIKTGTTPPWVGWQTAGYVRLLPPDLRPRVRRWSLTLRSDATYVLDPLLKRSDEVVFLAAVTIAHAKKGWLA